MLKYVSFLLHFRRNLPLARLRVEDLKRMDLPVDIALSLFKIERSLEAARADAAFSEGDASAAGNERLQTVLKTAQRTSSTARKLMREIIAIIAKIAPDDALSAASSSVAKSVIFQGNFLAAAAKVSDGARQHLLELFEDLHATEREAEAAFEQLLTRNCNSVSPLLVYASYLADVKFDAAGAEALRQRAAAASAATSDTSSGKDVGLQVAHTQGAKEDEGVRVRALTLRLKVSTLSLTALAAIMFAIYVYFQAGLGTRIVSHFVSGARMAMAQDLAFKSRSLLIAATGGNATGVAVAREGVAKLSARLWAVSLSLTQDFPPLSGSLFTYLNDPSVPILVASAAASTSQLQISPFELISSFAASARVIANASTTRLGAFAPTDPSTFPELYFVLQNSLGISRVIDQITGLLADEISAALMAIVAAVAAVAALIIVVEFAITFLLLRRSVEAIFAELATLIDTFCSVSKQQWLEFLHSAVAKSKVAKRSRGGGENDDQSDGRDSEESDSSSDEATDDHTQSHNPNSQMGTKVSKGGVDGKVQFALQTNGGANAQAFASSSRKLSTHKQGEAKSALRSFSAFENGALEEEGEEEDEEEEEERDEEEEREQRERADARRKELEEAAREAAAERKRAHERERKRREMRRRLDSDGQQRRDKVSRKAAIGASYILTLAVIVFCVALFVAFAASQVLATTDAVEGVTVSLHRHYTFARSALVARELAIANTPSMASLRFNGTAITSLASTAHMRCLLDRSAHATLASDYALIFGAGVPTARLFESRGWSKFSAADDCSPFAANENIFARAYKTKDVRSHRTVDTMTFQATCLTDIRDLSIVKAATAGSRLHPVFEELQEARCPFFEGGDPQFQFGMHRLVEGFVSNADKILAEGNNVVTTTFKPYEEMMRVSVSSQELGVGMMRVAAELLSDELDDTTTAFSINSGLFAPIIVAALFQYIFLGSRITKLLKDNVGIVSITNRLLHAANSKYNQSEKKESISLSGIEGESEMAKSSFS